MEENPAARLARIRWHGTDETWPEPEDAAHAATEVRRLADEQGLARLDVQKALGIVDRRTVEHYWSGAQPYSMSQLATLADLFGVPVAALLPSDARDGALPSGAPDSGTVGSE